MFRITELQKPFCDIRRLRLAVAHGWLPPRLRTSSQFLSE